MMQTVAISKAPIIASHSAVRALCDHPRNLDDEQLMALKRNGGVIQVAAYPAFVKTRKPDSAERVQAIAALRNVFKLPEPTTADDGRGYQQAWLKLTVQHRADYRSRLAEISAKFPADPPASVKDFVDHIDYAVKLIGIDHVGISSDFNNVDAGVTGWSDASETFNVTLELVRRAYTEEQIEKLWSGNLLRVMDRVQQIARDLQPQ
jgi:membrane dipeptidase